ncbi:MAG: outer membrane beta-barrel protein [Bacteroidia bacterium]|nr:outer membrane beta-barrel protein [Bacteroidia bacterium]
MKKILLFIAVLFISGQSYGQIAAGAGISYGFDSDFGNAGINIRGMYTEITDNLDGVLGINIFFPQTFGSAPFEVKYSIWTLNFDAHYNVPVGDASKVYPLAGINIANAKVKSETTVPFFGTTSSEATDSSFGFNIGAGGSTSLSDVISAFIEIKYVVGDYDQPVGTAGILYHFGQ